MMLTLFLAAATVVWVTEDRESFLSLPGSLVNLAGYLVLGYTFVRLLEVM